MKKEYDFSKALRGKFYHPKLKLDLPIYLDEDVAEFVQSYAKKKKVQPETVVNELLRRNKELIQTFK